MKTISLDLETYSDVELGKAGVYKYAESASFEILLLAYAIDGGPVEVVDLAKGEEIPAVILKSIMDDTVQKWAFNASFERICLSGYLRQKKLLTGYLSPLSWRCSMVWAAYMGLPLSLAEVGAVLGLDKQKMTEGRELIRFFCLPCREAKTGGGRTRNRPTDALEKWELFKKYNRRDVETELAIKNRLAKYPVPDFIWQEYQLDQAINDRGIGLDMTFVNQAISFDARSKDELAAELKRLTGLNNPNSVMQLCAWMAEQGIPMESLAKRKVMAVLRDAPEDVARVLRLRQKLAKSSVTKYQAMAKAVCADGRARGMFMFYGANRTGRYAGRIIQLQNLPQNHIGDLEEARELVRSGDYEALEALHDNVPDTLSQLIRTAFVPGRGKKFIVADFSSIEARVLAWLAGEKHTLESFARGEDLYCATASAMFGVAVEKHGVNADLRQKGKIATLACGYGGSVGALTAMGALDMGLKEEELKSIVDAWRSANPHIVALWWEAGARIIEAVKLRTITRTHGITFRYKGGMLFIDLPSGRSLVYVKPRITASRFGGEAVTYEGIGTNRRWERLESYGPKFVENIVQALARDILMHAMQGLSEFGICAHVHDEIIIECQEDVSVEEICSRMSQPPAWARGLLLSADGYECNFYRKE